jgi:hypothetical protein
LKNRIHVITGHLHGHATSLSDPEGKPVTIVLWWPPEGDLAPSIPLQTSAVGP